MKCASLVLFSFLFHTIGIVGLSAQTVTLRGIILDSSKRTPLKAVRVSLHRTSDSSVVKGAVTNGKGEYEITLPTLSNALVKVKRLGYSEVTKLLDLASRSSFVDTVFLTERVATSDEVEVIGWREFTEIRPEKKTYVIKNNPNVNGNTVGEVLDQIPAVQVDDQGTITLRGDANVEVMINDRPLRMDPEAKKKYLQQLPSVNVESIEVRTTPGAKYDAKFKAGIINIITSRGLKDYVGGNTYSSGTTNKRYGAGATIFYNDSTVTATGNIGGGNHYDRSLAVHRRLSPQSSSTSRIEKNTPSLSDHQFYYANPQVDVALTQNDVLSFAGSVNLSLADWSAQSIGQRFDALSIQSQNVADSTNSSSNGTWFDASILYKHQFEENHRISLDFNTSRWSNNRDEYKQSLWYFPSTGLDEDLSLRQTIRGEQTNPAVNARVDYSVGITEELNLEFGTKYEAESNPNTQTTQRWDYPRKAFQFDSATSNSLSPFYRMAAVYSTVGYSFSDDLTVQIGARYEYPSLGANFDGMDVRRSFPNVYPSASLSYSLDESTQFTLSYGRTVSMPWVGSLNPRISRESATYESHGNPDIKPEFENNFELTATTQIGGVSFTFSPFIQRTFGDIEYSGVLIGDVLSNTWYNFNGTVVYGFETSLSYRSPSGFSCRWNAEGESTRNIGSAISGDIPNTAFGWNSNANLSYTFFKGLVVSANTRYNSPLKAGFEQLSWFVSSYINATWKTFDDAFTVSLMFSDPFNVQKRIRTQYGTGYSLLAETKPWSQFATLSLTYSFGKTDVNLEHHNKEKTSTKGNTGG